MTNQDDQLLDKPNQEIIGIDQNTFKLISLGAIIFITFHILQFVLEDVIRYLLYHVNCSVYIHFCVTILVPIFLVSLGVNLFMKFTWKRLNAKGVTIRRMIGMNMVILLLIFWVDYVLTLFLKAQHVSFEFPRNMSYGDTDFISFTEFARPLVTIISILILLFVMTRNPKAINKK